MKKTTTPLPVGVPAIQHSWAVGIDPDTVKSGVAVWDTVNKSWVSIECLGFADLIKWLSANRLMIKEVILEGGWLNKSNWHLKDKSGRPLKGSICVEIGRRTGMNHQTGILIGEFIEGLTIAPLNTVNPLNNNWWAEDKKDLFNRAARLPDKTKTNPEKRDAAMLIIAKYF